MIALTVLAGPFASAAEHGKKKGHDVPSRETVSSASPVIDIDVVLGDYRRIVHEYVEYPPSGSLPPGLAKRGGDLPPGLEKQLRKNGKLPPGLQKRLTPCPRELQARLRSVGDDYSGGFLHGRFVIFNRHTSAILDVFIP